MTQNTAAKTVFIISTLASGAISGYAFSEFMGDVKKETTTLRLESELTDLTILEADGENTVLHDKNALSIQQVRGEKMQQLQELKNSDLSAPVAGLIVGTGVALGCAAVLKWAGNQFGLTTRKPSVIGSSPGKPTLG